jgi:PEP-CTERM motif
MRFALIAATLAASLAVPAAQAETVVYATSFEAPAYPTAPIGGGYYSTPQWVAANGWGAWPSAPYSADPSPWAAVTNERAASGTQSLRLSIDPATNGSIGVWRSFYPGNFDISPLRADPFTLSLKLYLQQTPDSDVTWSVGMQGAPSLGFSFTPDGRVYYAHGGQSTGAYFDPGFDVHNTWLNVSLVADAPSSGFKLTVSGRGHTFEQVVANPGYPVNQLSIGGAWPTFPTYKAATAYVDDVRLGYGLTTAVPEPESWALMLCGIAGLAAWRRKAGSQAGRAR